RRRAAGRGAGVAGPRHPGGGVRHPAEQPAVRPGHRHLQPRQRLLPAGAVGRVRGAVRLGRGRPGAGRVRAAPEGRMNALHAEWTKARTVAGPGALLLAAAALTAVVGVVAANATSCPGQACSVDPAKVSLTGLYLGQAVVAIIAVNAVSGEYSTGMMRLTLAATPRRWRVLAAKAAVVGTATLAAGAVAVLASVLAGSVLLARHGIDPAHGYEALSLGLVALLGLGVAAMIRDSAVAIGTVLGLLYLFPIVAGLVGNPPLQRHLDQV